VAFTAKTVTTLERDDSLQKGHYMADVKGHILALKNGVVEDWSRSTKKRINGVYRVTPTTTRKERRRLAKDLFAS